MQDRNVFQVDMQIFAHVAYSSTEPKIIFKVWYYTRCFLRVSMIKSTDCLSTVIILLSTTITKIFSQNK